MWTVKHYVSDDHPTLRGAGLEVFVAEPRVNVQELAEYLNEIETRARPHKESFTDETGCVWVPPTAWAYYAACRALKQCRERIEELENGKN